MRAVRDIQRLSLFPIVFTVGPVMSASLGDSYGEQCSSVMSEGESLLQELSKQASPCSMWWQDSSVIRLCRHMLIPILCSPRSHTVSHKSYSSKCCCCTNFPVLDQEPEAFARTRSL